MPGVNAPEAQEVDYHDHTLPSGHSHNHQHQQQDSPSRYNLVTHQPLMRAGTLNPSSQMIPSNIPKAEGYANGYHHEVNTEHLDTAPLGPPYQSPVSGGGSRRPGSMLPTERAAKRSRSATTDTGRRTITIKDRQRDNVVRVSVKTRNIDLDEMPDSFRREYSVFPRAHYPRQGLSSSSTESETLNPETKTESLVTWDQIPLGQWRLPMVAEERKKQERQMNDLGQHITWGKPQLFSGRNLLLQTTRKLLISISPLMISVHEFKRQSHSRFADSLNDIEPMGDVRWGKRDWNSFRESICQDSQSPEAPC